MSPQIMEQIRALPKASSPNHTVREASRIKGIFGISSIHISREEKK
jgi:hypothetical protein